MAAFVSTEKASQAVTAPSSRTATFIESADRSQEEIDPMAQAPGEGEPEDSFEMVMGPNDPDNPKTFSRPYRWVITMTAAILVMNAYVPNSPFLSRAHPAR